MNFEQQNHSLFLMCLSNLKVKHLLKKNAVQHFLIVLHHY